MSKFEHMKPCGYCKTLVSLSDPEAKECALCGSIHHGDCHKVYDRCTTYGCDQSRQGCDPIFIRPSRLEDSTLFIGLPKPVLKVEVSSLDLLVAAVLTGALLFSCALYSTPQYSEVPRYGEIRASR